MRAHLCALPTVLVDRVIAYIDDEDAFPAALSCSVLRDAVYERWPPKHGGARLHSPWRWAVASVSRAQWAHATGLALNEDVCAAAAALGRQDVVEWLRGAGCPWDEGVYAAAMEEGHKALMRWLKKNGCPNDPLGWGRT
jgi:hypothetical protein